MGLKQQSVTSLGLEAGSAKSEAKVRGCWGGRSHVAFPWPWREGERAWPLSLYKGMIPSITTCSHDSSLPHHLPQRIPSPRDSSSNVRSLGVGATAILSSPGASSLSLAPPWHTPGCTLTAQMVSAGSPHLPRIVPCSAPAEMAQEVEAQVCC